MEMRKAFASFMMDNMAKDWRLCVLDADLANADGTLALRKTYPERAFDVGIAEQNMASIAAGMSSYGFIPFITTFACFASRRICDQIAISCAYAKQNVKIVGTDPGVTAEINGGTHMAIEDIGVLRSIPNIVIFEPCDEAELVTALPQIIEHQGPVYIRLHRKEVPVRHEDGYVCSLGKADVLRDGTDVTLFASGAVMVGYALESADMLANEGISAAVVNIHTVKPIDRDAVSAYLAKTGCGVCCENPNVIGGLYSAVCEVSADCCPAPVKAIGFQDVPGEVGQTKELAEKKGMLPKDIAAAAKSAIAAKK